MYFCVNNESAVQDMTFMNCLTCAQQKKALFPFKYLEKVNFNKLINTTLLLLINQYKNTKVFSQNGGENEE